MSDLLSCRHPMRLYGSTISGAFSGADSAILDGLAKRGHVVDVFGAEVDRLTRLVLMAETFHPRRQTWGKRWYAKLSKSPRSFRSRTRQADKFLRPLADKFDAVLHIGGLFAPFLGAPPKPVVLFCDYTSRLAERNYPPWLQLSRSMTKEWFRLEEELYHSAAVIFTASENTRQSFIKDFHIDPENVQVVGEGIHTLPPARTAPYDRPVVLFVGLDFERKGGETLLAAFSQARSRMESAELWIVGPRPGSPRQGVRWLGEVRDQARLSEVFTSASVFAMPSLCEPFGLTFIEAMSHSLPVIGTRADAMPEIISSEETGLLVTPGAVDELAGALLRLLSSPAECERMGRAGRRVVAGRYMWEQVVTRIEDRLRTTLCR